MKHDPPWDTDVLVVGAGPTGLTLADQLTMRGVRCRIIDSAEVRSDRSRALVVQPRTLELLDKVGLAGGLVATGQPTLQASLYVSGDKIADIDTSTLRTDDTPFPFVLFVSQVETERALEGHLAGQGVPVERPVELVTFTQDGAGVTALLRRGGGQEETVRAGYLVGADGAHSVVRRIAGLSFEGAPYSQDFVLADLDLEWELGHDRIAIFLTDSGPFVVIPMKGERACRIIATRSEAPNQDAGDPTLEEIQGLARAMCPVPMTLKGPRWLARFRLHHRGVDRYRVGRAFVAGDAAHIHSPAGGQGMNTGIQDAWNLSWKLGLVLSGHAREELLDSYHDERHPVGQALLRSTDAIFALNTTGNPLIVRLRNFAARWIIPHALGSQWIRERGFRFIGQLSIAYPDSPIVDEDLYGADGDFRRGPGKGQRAPDGPLDGPLDQRTNTPGPGENGRGQGLLRDVLLGPAHHLLVFSGRGAASDLPALRQVGDAVKRYQGMIEVSYVMHKPPAGAAAEERLFSDSTGVTHARYGLDGPGYYLVRPDGYIAFRSCGTDPGALQVYLHRHFTSR